jgi:hypothetical protein
VGEETKEGTEEGFEEGVTVIDYASMLGRPIKR